MTHILKLLSGDRGNPTNELDLNQLTAGEIRLTAGGLVPNPGQLNVLYTGESIRYNGELPVKESRGNMRLELRYNIQGGSSADISRIQREITQFLRDAKLYNQDGQGEAVWLEYRWNTSQALDDLPRPTWGQLNYYAEILSAEVRWPDNIHEQGYLNSDFVEGVVATLVCKPHWYGLEQMCITTPGLMDVTDQYNTTLSGVDFSGEWSIVGWFKSADSLATSNYVMRYYVDANNYFYIYQFTSGRIYLTYRVSGANTAVSVVATAAANHFAIVQSATTANFYVNGAYIGALSASAWSTSGTFYLGCYDNVGTGTETTTTLDGWRIWEGDTLTAAQVAALYTEEKAIKDAGGWVGKPPYLYTYNATNKIYRGNSTTSGGYNCAIVGNVNGSGVDALAKYTINGGSGSTSATMIYFGRMATTEQIDITNNPLLYDTSTATATANNLSFNDYYSADTLAAGGGNSKQFWFDLYDGAGVEKYAGRFMAIARLYVSGTIADTVTAQLQHLTAAGLYREYDSVTLEIVSGTNWKFVELSDITITKNDANAANAANSNLIVVLSQVQTNSVTVRGDYLALIPYPYVKLAPFNSSEYLNGDHVANYSTGNLIKYDSTETTRVYRVFSSTGPTEGVTLEPGKYNVLPFQFDKYSGSVDVDSYYITLTTTVIPRWTLPGGLVA